MSIWPPHVHHGSCHPHIHRHIIYGQAHTHTQSDVRTLPEVVMVECAWDPSTKEVKEIRSGAKSSPGYSESAWRPVSKSKTKPRPTTNPTGTGCGGV